MKTLHAPRTKFIALILCATLAAIPAAPAAIRTWTAGGETIDWSDASNWNALPTTSDSVRFQAAGLADEQGIPTNRVTQNTTFQALSYYRYDSTGWHTTEIEEGVILTLTGAAADTILLHVGGWGSTQAAPQTTQAAITGRGTLQVNQTTAHLHIGSTTSQITRSELDLGGLASFEAALNRIEVGQGNLSIGILRLAEENSLTATELRIGFSNGALGNNNPEVLPSELVLGKSNLLQIDQIYIGASPNATRNTSSGKLSFAAGLSDAKVTLRGATGGNSAARMVIGSTGGNGQSSRSQGGIADFTGGEIDAVLSDLVIAHGYHAGSSVSQVNGSFSMDRGSVVADEVIVSLGDGVSGIRPEWVDGRLSVGGGEFSTGTLEVAINRAAGQNVRGLVEISGGTFSVTGANPETGNAILLGERNGLSAEINASIILSGGLLSVSGGNIQTGSGTQVESKIALSGGSLDLHGHEMTVDLLDLESGRLENIGEFNTRAETGATVAKTATGTVTVAGVNTWSGLTDIQAGTLLLESGAELRDTAGVIVRSGATFGGAGTVGSNIAIEAFGSLSLTLSQTPENRLRVNGSLTLAANTDLQLTLNEAAPLGTLFQLVEMVNENTLSGAFATINGEAFLPGDRFELHFDGVDYSFRLIYGDGSTTYGHHLFAQAIPEPSGMAFLALGAALAVLCRRRLS